MVDKTLRSSLIPYRPDRPYRCYRPLLGLTVYYSLLVYLLQNKDLRQFTLGTLVNPVIGEIRKTFVKDIRKDLDENVVSNHKKPTDRELRRHYL